MSLRHGSSQEHDGGRAPRQARKYGAKLDKSPRPVRMVPGRKIGSSKRPRKSEKERGK